jgi:hypothetical protein
MAFRKGKDIVVIRGYNLQQCIALIKANMHGDPLKEYYVTMLIKLLEG